MTKLHAMIRFCDFISGMLDLHRGAGDLCTTREDITINRAFQETSSNVLFHIINIALLNRALPLSRYLRRTIGGTHCTTLPLSSKLFVQINKRCSLNVVVVRKISVLYMTYSLMKLSFTKVFHYYRWKRCFYCYSNLWRKRRAQ